MIIVIIIITKPDEWLLLLRIREVPGSNLDPETSYPA
jgi:hypothetical protein